MIYYHRYKVTYIIHNIKLGILLIFNKYYRILLLIYIMNIIELHKDLIDKRDLLKLSKITSKYFFEIMNKFYINKINNDDIFNYNEIKINNFTINNIKLFIYEIMYEFNLDEVLIIPAIVYLDDFLLTIKQFSIYKNTWKQLILVAIIISQKMYDDFSYNNYNFAYKIAGNKYDCNEYTEAMNKIKIWEQYFLNTINFRLYLIESNELNL